MDLIMHNLSSERPRASQAVDEETLETARLLAVHSRIYLVARISPHLE